MSVELTAIESWMTTIFNADPTLTSLGVTGCFSESVPSLQPGPYIVLTQYGGQDVMPDGHTRVNVPMVYLVRATTQTRSYSSLQPIADRIDTLLHGQTGTALGHVIEGCVRQAPYSMVEDRGDIQWRHLGGRYLVYVSA